MLQKTCLPLQPFSLRFKGTDRSLLHPTSHSQLREEQGGTVRATCNPHGASFVTASDEDQPPVPTCRLQEPPRPLHQVLVVPPQAAAPGVARAILRHHLGFHSTPKGRGLWASQAFCYHLLLLLPSHLISRSALQLLQVLPHHHFWLCRRCCTEGREKAAEVRHHEARAGRATRRGKKASNWPGRQGERRGLEGRKKAAADPHEPQKGLQAVQALRQESPAG